jgi:hypothetical protein
MAPGRPLFHSRGLPPRMRRSNAASGMAASLSQRAHATPGSHSCINRQHRSRDAAAPEVSRRRMLMLRRSLILHRPLLNAFARTVRRALRGPRWKRLQRPPRAGIAAAVGRPQHSLGDSRTSDVAVRRRVASCRARAPAPRGRALAACSVHHRHAR